MDTSILEGHMSQMQEMINKLHVLLPELRNVPVVPTRTYFGMRDLVIHVENWDDWKTLRRHFCKRMTPRKVGRGRSEKDGSAWMYYKLDDHVNVTINVP